MLLTPDIGSNLTYTDTQGSPTTLAFLGGSVPSTTTVVLTPTVAPNRQGLDWAGHAWELAAESETGPLAAFLAPVTATIRYSDADVQVISDELALTLAWWDGSGWQDAPSTCASPGSYTRDPAQNLLSIPLCRPGRYALFGPTHQIAFPLVGTARR